MYVLTKAKGVMANWRSGSGGDDHDHDAIADRREHLESRQQFLFFLMGPLFLWIVYSNSTEAAFLDTTLGQIVTYALLLLQMLWALTLLYTIAKLQDLPKAEPDERERMEGLQRISNAFLSTVLLVTLAIFVNIFMPFSANMFGAIFYFSVFVSLRFPVIRTGYGFQR